MRRQLTFKADEYRALKSEVDQIDAGLKRLSNLKAAAQDAIANVNLDEVEDLLARLQEVELDEAAKTAELRANNALLRGKPDQTFALLSAAADSFAALDPLEPAQRRLKYEDLLYQHGYRYGSRGMTLAAQMNRVALLSLDRGESAIDWARAQNNLGIALQNQGIRSSGATGADLLAETVTAYRSALRIRTETEHPVGWAITQNNLAEAQRAIAQHDSTATPRPHLEAALPHVASARTVFDPVHLPDHHGTATTLRELILTALNTPA